MAPHYLLVQQGGENPAFIEGKMDKSKLEQLLRQMPEIAKAVNEFKSEELQRKAFEALVLAAGIPSSAIASRQEEKLSLQAKRIGTPRKQKGGADEVANQGRGRRSGDTYRVLDLDLRPSGKPSLREFMKQKGPSTDPEKYACMIQYLKQHLGIESVTPDHLFTCFKEIAEKVPNIRQGLINTYHRHGWITKTGKSGIALTRAGQNVVEHDLPRKRSAPQKD